MAQPVASGIRVPDATQTLGNIMNMARGAVALQRETATLPADIAKAKAESQVSVGTAQPRIEQSQQTAEQSKIQTNLAQFKLTGEYAQKARDISQQLVSDPDVMSGNAQGIIPKIAAARQMMVESGVPPAIAEVQAAHLMTAAAQDPKSVRQILLNSIQAGLGSSGQAAAVVPGGPGFNTGQVSGQMNTNPLAGPSGPIQGTVTQNVPGPATQVFNPRTGQYELLGARAGGGAGGVPTAPALGQEAGVAGTVNAVNQDWTDTQNRAANASQDIGVLQKIKEVAPGAVTGVGADRRAYVAGLAGLLGIEPGQLEKTNTDLLAKNSNMLALAGGDTNLARTMAEAANPNTHMTPQAIKDAADQIIAQRKMALAKQKFLAPFKTLNNPAAYTSALTEWNQVADPRVLQLEGMSKEEMAKMKASMSPVEQKEFGKKIRRLHELGILGE